MRQSNQWCEGDTVGRSASSRKQGWRGWRLAAVLACGGLIWCAVVGVLIWVVPSGTSTTTSSDGVATTGPGESFSSISGLGPVPLLIPVALVGVAVWASLRLHRAVLIVATALLAVYCFLTGFSIGLAYVPAAVALVVACVVSAGPRRNRGDA
jgi:hypothetical protein